MIPFALVGLPARPPICLIAPIFITRCCLIKVLHYLHASCDILAHCPAVVDPIFLNLQNPSTGTNLALPNPKSSKRLEALAFVSISARSTTLNPSTESPLYQYVFWMVVHVF